MALTQGNYLGDWLINEFEAPDYCRSEVTVLVPSDMESGCVLGVESTFSKYAAYNNSDPSAAAAILVGALQAKDAVTVTSITDSSNTATIVFPVNHGLVNGDIIKISGATVDTDLNGNYSFTKTSATQGTVTSASVTDQAYTETTLRVQKLNQLASVLVRGPATVSKSGLNWGTSDGTGITAGLADLLALGIVAREGV